MDLEPLVWKALWMVLGLLGAGAVFGLLFFLINYVSGPNGFPSEPMTLFAKVARVLLIVMAVIVLIVIILAVASGGSMFTWGGSRGYERY